jgi:oligopeptide/dipeptide ABC transporter ATP-binding protein
VSEVDSKLLRVKNLQTFFYTREGVVRAVDDVGFSLGKGGSLGLVGESGCGKSTLAHSILKIVPEPGRIAGGSIVLEGEDIVRKNEDEMREIRGQKASIIFQEPKAAMNPLIKLGNQIAEAIEMHKGVGHKEAMEETIKLLELTGVTNPDDVVESYAFRESPGVVQQCVIAMALSCTPSLLIADEPTTAMDTSTEARIIWLLKDLMSKFSFSMLYITHNLSVVAQLCDFVAVMYAGKIVELGQMREIFKNPIHPYTVGLLHAAPRYDVVLDRLPEIPGIVASLVDPPKGCRFYPRCSIGCASCKDKEPPLGEFRPNHFVACWQQAE